MRSIALLGLLFAALLAGCGGGGVTPTSLAASLKTAAQQTFDRRANTSLDGQVSVLVQSVVCEPIQARQTYCTATVLARGSGAVTFRVTLTGTHWIAVPADDSPAISGVVG